MLFNRLPVLRARRDDDGTDLTKVTTDVRGVDDEDFSGLETDMNLALAEGDEGEGEQKPEPKGRGAEESEGEGAGAGEGEGAEESEGEGEGEPQSELAEGVKTEAPTNTGTPKVKGKMIPLDRHEKLLKKERARREQLETQLSQSQAGRQMADTNDRMAKAESELVELEQKYNDLLAEGDTKGAASTMTQMRHKNAELAGLAGSAREAELLALAVEKVRIEEAVERIEEAYPELDPNSDDFDQESFDEVADLTAVKKQRGMSPTKALQAAVKQVMGVRGGEQERATTVAPRVNEKAVADAKAAKDAGAERRSEAVKRNIATASRVPPATHRAGAGNDDKGGQLTVKRMNEMTEKEFEALGDKELNKALGIA